MPSASPFDLLSRRLSVYGYLAPLVDGARVLEVGTGEGQGAAHLLRLGALRVVGADADGQALARARASQRAEGLSFQPLERRALENTGAGSGADGRGFDLIVVPDALALLRAGSQGFTAAAARSLLAPGGRLVLLVASADAPGVAPGTGAGYYEVAEVLERLFPRVRMFGVTPFAAYGVAEFAEAPSGLRIDGGLVEAAGEQPTHYLGVAGPDDGPDLGYALVQVPSGAGEGGGDGRVRPGLAAPSLDEDRDQADLRRRLAEAEGRAEGVLRVSRAQTEEIEELRARLRRAGEATAELDREVERLRRALAEADESVLDLSRRTREEVDALARRITSGLRPGEAAAVSPEELRRRDEALAARESALSERDDRIAGLEADRQDLLWQLESAAALHSQAFGDTVAADLAPEDAEDAEDVAQEAEASEDAEPAEGAAPAAAEAVVPASLEPYRRAAAVHLAEVNRLREALAEQSTLVMELEDGLATRERRLSALETEAEGLRRHTAEIEQADRARRSRLAEVEGTLLRLQRQAALAASQQAEAAAASNGAAGNGLGSAEALAAVAARAELERRNQDLFNQVRTLEQKLEEASARQRQGEERERDLGRRLAEAIERVAELERAAAERPSEAPAGEANVEGPRLDVALREVSRLREALERSEEQLWETKGQLLLDRERMAVLEHEIGNAAVPAASDPLPSEPTVSEAAHRSIVNAMLAELGEIETSMRGELARLESIERTIEGWRSDLAVTDAEIDLNLPTLGRSS